jgi:type I restriction enzyme R subunit
LFGDENAKEVVFKKPFEQQKQEFEEKLSELKEKVPAVNDIDSIQSEEEKADFVQTFRDLMRIKSSLETFAEFDFAELGISEQEFYDYQSKYLDIYEDRKNKEGKELESVLDQIDFELELVGKDIVNFDYIIKLIVGLKDVTSDTLREKKADEILKIFDRDIQLRKKKEFIQKFIKDNLPNIGTSDEVEVEFEKFWQSERSNALRKVAESENINIDSFQTLIGDYIYTQKTPLGDDIVALLPETTRNY